ncbi:MAG TPA: NAD-dependent epimerase/dehydratase family protein [Chitinophagaceae bacterium]|nr:NAD-dependent epimerase/dehydratase family protein [Chitinophagaceae bacterium]
MQILVTGATGFIGSKLCMALAGSGNKVHALCRNVNSSLLPVHKNIHPYRGDLLDKRSLSEAMQGCRHVYHTAALAKMWVRKKTEFHHINVTGTKNVMETAIECNVEKLVHTSTCGVWGPVLKHPVTEEDPRITGFPIDYERTKYLAELEVNAAVKKGLRAVIVNPSRVYGEGPVTEGNIVGRMVQAYLQGRWHVNPAKGLQVSNYAYVNDVVQGHIAAMQKGVAGHRYILGGEDISFNHFFFMLQKVSGIHRMLFKVPQQYIQAYSYFEAFKTAVTGLPPVLLPAVAERLKYNQRYSSAKAIQQLDYTITPFANAFKKTVQYLQHAK